MAADNGTQSLPGEAAPPQLVRTLSLGHALLYGLGVTIGAGIYVLVGAAAGRLGYGAPVAFALAAVLMAFTAASFAELGVRLPVAAGEAAYVRAGFASDRLATFTARTMRRCLKPESCREHSASWELQNWMSRRTSSS